MRDILIGLPAALNFLLFASLAGGIWFAGSRLTYLADALSERLKLAASTVGLLFLALATSLPELATTSAAAVKQSADLVLNNLFGGIALQTAILAFADFWAKGAISNYPRKSNHALESTLLVVLMACLQIVFLLGEPVSFFGVGLGSTVVGLAYVGVIWLLRWYENNPDWVPVDLPDVANDVEKLKGQMLLLEKPERHLFGLSLIACLAIAVLGTGIVEVSEILVLQTGLGTGFFGVTLLAAATSLPELSTTITAVRMGAYTLAISNIFGSNLIMIVLVLPADILHTSAPILGVTTPSTHLAIATGILVTAIFLVGLIIRRKPKIGPIGIDSFLVLVVYACSLLIHYGLR